MSIENRRSPSSWFQWKQQEYYCNYGSRLPMMLSEALGEVEETVKVIHAELGEITELNDQTLQALIGAVPTQLILQNLLLQMLQCIRQVMAVDTVTVLLQNKDGQQLAVQATLGLEEEITKKIQIPIGQGFAGSIAAICEPRVVADLSTVEVVSPVLRNKGIQSIVGVPLLVKNRTVGVFHIGTVRPRQFTKDDVRLLQLVADHIGSAVDNLEISSFSITKTLTPVREKSALADLWQTVRRTLKNVLVHLQPTGSLRLASLLS